MLKIFLEDAARGRSVYITDVRDAFQARGTRPFHLRAALYDGSVRTFPLLLPGTEGPEEEHFVEEYVHASVYNLLSALGGVRLDVYLDREDRAALDRRASPEEMARGAAAMERAAADGGLANTGLMKQLNVYPGCTVAQFAQAVGAVHYACLGLK